MARIESWVAAWLAVLADPDVLEPPTFEVLRRTTSNVTLIQQPPQAPPQPHQHHQHQQQQGAAIPPAAAAAAAAANQGGLSALVHGDGMVVKRLRGQGARSYAAIFAVLAFAHKLLLSGE